MSQACMRAAQYACMAVVILLTLCSPLRHIGSAAHTAHALCFIPAALQFSASVCKPTGNSDAISRLCHYLPMVQEQITLAMASIMKANAGLAALALAATIAGSWHQWELSFVERKASKHKRRRRHRKNSIPW